MEDIALLAAHFAEKYARPGKAPCQFTPEAMELILTYSWPGNIRQLENAVSEPVVTAKDGMILPENLPADLAKPVTRKASFPMDLARPLPEQLSEVIADFEKRYLRRASRRAAVMSALCPDQRSLPSERHLQDRSVQDDTSIFKQE